MIVVSTFNNLEQIISKNLNDNSKRIKYKNHKLQPQYE